MGGRSPITWAITTDSQGLHDLEEATRSQSWLPTQALQYGFPIKPNYFLTLKSHILKTLVTSHLQWGSTQHFCTTLLFWDPKALSVSSSYLRSACMEHLTSKDDGGGGGGGGNRGQWWWCSGGGRSREKGNFPSVGPWAVVSSQLPSFRKAQSFIQSIPSKSGHRLFSSTEGHVRSCLLAALLLFGCGLLGLGWFLLVAMWAFSSQMASWKKAIITFGFL